MKLRQSISYKLASTGVLLAFCLGLMVSGAQVYFDYLNQKSAFGNMVGRMLNVTRPTASRAIHTLDERLAAEVVNGLMVYNFVVKVAVVDELQNVLAQQEKDIQQSNTDWLTNLIGLRFQELSEKIYLDSIEGKDFGLLNVTVDYDVVYGSLYERGLTIFITGFLRNLLLVLLFFIAFYWLVAKPLTRFSRELREIDPDHPHLKLINQDDVHRDDEIGHLIDVSNQYLQTVSNLLQERRERERIILESERHKHKIIDTVPHMIYARNHEGKFVFANTATANAYNLDVKQLENSSLKELHQAISEQQMRLFRSGDMAIISGESDSSVGEEIFTGADGAERILHTHRVPLNYYGETLCLCVSVDVTEQKNAEAIIRHQAYHDPLTNLPNRLRLIESIERELERSLRHDYVGAVLFIDLDHFKKINDSLGHPVGDLVLQEIATRLQNNSRIEDLVARLGGDEFVVVTPEIGDSMELAVSSALEIAEKLREVIARPILSTGKNLKVTASIGIVLFPEPEKDVHEILKYADTAMYHAKEEGRDTIEFFSASMATQVDQHLEIENDLRKAIEEEQFILHYQPQIETTTRKVVGAEALLRWMHPEKGLISPADFISILESSWLMIPAGRWLLRRVFLDVKSWFDSGLWDENNRVAINISPRQFRDKSFVADVKSLIDELNIDADWIEFEITEGIVIHNVDETIEIMNSLCELGISFSLDDFGTGYSSLSYLKRLPVSVLKIDQAFVRDITTDPNDAAIVEATLAMAKGLGLEVIAEGVETAEQLAFLLARDCSMCQGYFFSRPLPLPDFEAFISAATH
ncbi:MAG: EAL domain-containing protein [Pseudomonadales bacterium]|nr:EAL domain-containing protein [Pseudomonadales bacterium]